MEEEYLKAHDSAQHYHNLILTIFPVGASLSLYILYIFWFTEYPKEPAIKGAAILLFGLLVLFYSALAIKRFSDKRKLMYQIFNKSSKKINWEKELEKINSMRLNGWSIPIFSAIFIFYIATFFINGNVFLGIFSAVLLFVILVNSLKRNKK